jgi:hypothetical protein
MSANGKTASVISLSQRVKVCDSDPQRDTSNDQRGNRNCYRDRANLFVRRDVRETETGQRRRILLQTGERRPRMLPPLSFASPSSVKDPRYASART